MLSFAQKASRFHRRIARSWYLNTVFEGLREALKKGSQTKKYLTNNERMHNEQKLNEQPTLIERASDKQKLKKTR